MEPYCKTVEIRWADLDPNFHVLHSKYYDFGAYCRTSFLIENGLTTKMMAENNIGPILFREECIFKREIVFGDIVSIKVVLKAASAQYRKWTMYQEIFKNDDVLAAIITVDGAWIDTKLRKLVTPTQAIIDVFDKAPKAIDFIQV